MVGQEWRAGKLRELRLRKADGSLLWVEVCYEITGRAESHFVVIARDISERNHLARASRQECFLRVLAGLAPGSRTSS